MGLDLTLAGHILRHVREGIVVITADGAVVSMNPAAERIFGLTGFDPAGAPIGRLLPGLSWDWADGTPRELDGRDTEGRVFAAEVALSRISEAAEPLYCVVVRDVSERRRAETAAAAERNFISAILDTTSAILLVIDRDGRIVRFNRACEEISGYPADEIAGRLVWEFLDVPEEQESIRRATAAVRAGHSPPRGETWLRTKSGALRRIAWSNAILRDHRDQPAYLISIGIDLTEQRLLREQLLHSQKMEAMGRLAGGVAHDFNNLLTAISGFAELVVDTLGPEDPRRSDMAEIQKAAERAACLTRQLLAFSRKQVIQPQVLDLNGVVRGLELMLRRLLREDVQLVLDLAPSCGAVRMDRGQLEQVVINLAINARDAMPQGGRVKISSVTLIHPGRSHDLRTDLQPGTYTRLTISDDGHGISAADLPHIFEPFFTTKQAGKGTGLGLSTVYGIVTQAGGGIGVESKEGVGTTFHIYLPVAGAVPLPETAGPPPSREAAQGSETVLLVEDEAEVREVIRRVLARAGYRVLTAASGEEAVVRGAECGGRIHLLVTDIIMPGMFGPQLYQSLSRQFPGLRVLYISGHTHEESIRDLEIPADAAFLQKPFAPDLLIRRVREVLAGAQLSSR